MDVKLFCQLLGWFSYWNSYRKALQHQRRVKGHQAATNDFNPL